MQSTLSYSFLIFGVHKEISIENLNRKIHDRISTSAGVPAKILNVLIEDQRSFRMSINQIDTNAIE